MSSATSPHGVPGKVPGPSAVSGRNYEGREGEGFCTEEGLISNLFVRVQSHVAQTASGCALNERAVVWKPVTRLCCPRQHTDGTVVKVLGRGQDIAYKLLDIRVLLQPLGVPT